ncbi:Zinc-binding dehydrogenase [Ceratobasidium sp. AG-Ba]|nr:Zinc-binding dehydrogenase [Ceratobasidium sp. AG-Ba]QRW01375.1 Zinc-binding dehydrogenase [Ceratobasidium sp. AG-Ba]
MVSIQKASFLLEQHGRLEVGTRQVPLSPGPGQALVKVTAAAINPVDWKLKDHYGFLLKEYPAILGSDGAGIVETIGPEVSDLKKGDRVFFQGRYNPDFATFQQYTLVDSKLLAKTSDSVTDDEASTIPVAIIAAGFALFQKSSVQFPLNEPTGSGKSVLIIGGSSSVGQYGKLIVANPLQALMDVLLLSAIQLARIAGFSPIVTTASAKHAEHLRGLGATHIVDRSADVKTIQAAFKEPVALVVDTISQPDTQSTALGVLHTPTTIPGAHLAVVTPLQEHLKAKNEALGSSSVSINEVQGISHSNREIAEPFWRAIGSWLESGKLVPNRVQVVPGGLEAVAEALKLSKEGVSGVKLVIHPQD